MTELVSVPFVRKIPSFYNNETVHMAIGNSKSLGGKVDVPLHIDDIIRRPTLMADEKMLIKNGNWTLI